MAEPSRLRSLGDRLQEVARPVLPAEPVVVALSGGADSAACAWVAGRLTERVRAVFVDHGFPESAAMRKAAEEIATQLSLELAVVEVEVGDRSSPEAQARMARYQALEGQLGNDEWLLTGHTADDQAETVLLNLVRGSGSRGLGGIPVRRGRIVRPLLAATRSETRELASLLGLAWRDDPTNADVRIPRNAIRREVLPALSARFNPRLSEALVRTATLAAQDDAFLGELAGESPVLQGSGLVRTPRGALLDRPAALTSRVARDLLRALTDHPGAQPDVEGILATARDGRTRTLAGGLAVELEGPWIILSVRKPVAEERPGILELPGAADLGAFHVEAWVESAPPVAFPLSPWMAVFDAEEVGAEAVMRLAAEGDSVAMRHGHKLVREALREARVPPRLRDQWPVLLSDGDIWWVPGVRLSQRHWVTASTRRYLWVSAERESV